MYMHMHIYLHLSKCSSCTLFLYLLLCTSNYLVIHALDSLQGAYQNKLLPFSLYDSTDYLMDLSLYYFPNHVIVYMTLVSEIQNEISLCSRGQGGMLNCKREFKGVRLQSGSGGKPCGPPLTADSGMWLIMWDLCHWEPFSGFGGHGVISSSNRLPFVQWAPGEELHKTLFFFFSSSHLFFFFFFTMGKWGKGMSIKQLFFPFSPLLKSMWVLSSHSVSLLKWIDIKCIEQSRQVRRKL